MNDSHLLSGLVGLPITEERARELARTVACSLSDVSAIAALAELLLGIAPSDGVESDRDLSADLWTRHAALGEAMGVLYSFTPEYREALEQYARNLRMSGQE